MIGEYVVCINNESMSRITINKIYKVNMVTNFNSYYIINDEGNEDSYYTYSLLKEIDNKFHHSLIGVTN